MENSDHIQRREHYRLRYPATDRPRATVDNREARVAEISEGGLRLRLDPETTVKVGVEISLTVHFPDGENLHVEGLVLRHHGEETVVRLTKGVSFQRMIAEQVWIKEKFPTYFDQPGEE